jgi:phosphorylase kinase alpha/beta subunit
MLEEMWRRKGADLELTIEEQKVTLSQFAQNLYESATVCHEWNLVRRIADLTQKYDDRIEDVLLDIVIRQKRLAVGRSYSGKATFSKPHESTDIVKTIMEFCGNNTAESVLTQEIILHLGYLIRNEPELFENMLTIRTWYLIQLLVGQISREENLQMADAYERLITLAPHTIYDRLHRVLKSFTREVSLFLVQENLHASGRPSFESIKQGPMLPQITEVNDWPQWRLQMGMVGPLSPVFYKDIWYLLRRCNGLVIGDKYNVQSRIGSELTLESTAGEQSFALKIDALLQSIDAPDYRQLNVELIECLARLFRENPDLHLEDDLIMDVLIGHAVRISWEKHSASKNYNEHRSEAWKAFYECSPVETDKAFLEAFMFLLSPQDTLHDLTV